MSGSLWLSAETLARDGTPVTGAQAEWWNGDPLKPGLCQQGGPASPPRGARRRKQGCGASGTFGGKRVHHHREWKLGGGASQNGGGSPFSNVTECEPLRWAPLVDGGIEAGRVERPKHGHLPWE